MKKITFLLCCLICINFSWAQLPDSSYAPDFSIYEINKNNGQIMTGHEYTLSEYTTAGKPVFLDFFTTWCGFCWNYHNSGAFENLYNTYGPNGTNEVMVFGLESNGGNYASLTGTGPDENQQISYGNWLDGVPYPIIPLAMSPNSLSVVDDYQVTAFPTIYMVCPNRNVFMLGQYPTDTLYAAINKLCTDAHLQNDARAVKLSGVKSIYHCNAQVAPVLKIQNLGDATLTSIQFEINYDGQTSSFTWTGNVVKNQDIDINLPEINETEEGNHSYSVTIIKVNGADDEDSFQNSLSKDFNCQFVGFPEVDEDFATDDFWDTWHSENDLTEWGQEQQAVVFHSFDLLQDVTDYFYVPLVDLTGYIKPMLQFDLAHARFGGFTYDRLRVRVSSDCGETWNRVYNKEDPLLTTAENTMQQFVPTQSSDWRTETIDLTDYKSNQVLTRFEFVSGYGNDIWIDNVKIVEGSGDGIDEQNKEFSIYPNPTSSILNITSNAQVEKVEIYNLQGQLVGMENGNVQSINVSKLTAGSYIIRVNTTDGVLNQMFVKE